MNFYIKTHYSEIVRTWFFRKNYVIDLISIGVVAENGKEFFAANDDFHSRYITKSMESEILGNLPTRDGHSWISLDKIASSLVEFMMYHSAHQDVQLVFEHPLDYAAFCSLMGTTQNPKWPIWLPKYYMDLRQSIREYLADTPDERFDNDPDIGTVLIRYDQSPFRLDQKLEMLESHREYPELQKAYRSDDHARNMRKLHMFFKKFKISYSPNKIEDDISREL